MTLFLWILIGILLGTLIFGIWAIVKFIVSLDIPEMGTSKKKSDPKT